MNVPPDTQARPQFPEPVFLTRMVDELDTARGWGLGLPILKLVLLIGLPSTLIGWLLGLSWPGPAGPDIFSRAAFAILGAILMTPALETVVMRLMFHFGARWIRSPADLNLVCALLWGYVHQQSPTWGLHAIWGFYVLGACFLRLQARSLDRAYYVVILIHALVNLIAYAGYLWETAARP